MEFAKDPSLAQIRGPAEPSPALRGMSPSEAWAARRCLPFPIPAAAIPPIRLELHGARLWQPDVDVPLCDVVHNGSYIQDGAV
jgi:hypothetical protein